MGRHGDGKGRMRDEWWCEGNEVMGTVTKGEVRGGTGVWKGVSGVERKGVGGQALLPSELWSPNFLPRRIPNFRIFWQCFPLQQVQLVK